MAKKKANRFDLDQILADPQSGDAQRLRRILLDHLADSCPAWLWDARSGELIWQNDAAQMYSSKRAGKKSKPVTPDAMKGQLRRILDITPLGQETLSRLHFSTGKKPFNRICRCTPMQLAGDERIGILSVSVDPVGVFEKVEADSLFGTAKSLGFAAALIRRGGVVLEQSDGFAEMIGEEFDSELIVGLSGAARHGNPIAVESEDGRREFYITRVASKESGKDKTYLALIDLIGGIGVAVEPELISLVSHESNEDAVESLSAAAETSVASEPSAPVGTGPLSALIDQLSGLPNLSPPIARSVDEVLGSLGLPSGTLDDESNEDRDDKEILTRSVEASADMEEGLHEDLQEELHELSHEFSGDSLAEQDRYNFNEVSRILTRRLSGEASGRGRHLSSVGGTIHSAAEISALAALASGNGDDGSIVLNQDHLILNRLPLGILIYRDQEIMFSNRAMVKLLGYNTGEELRKRGISAVIPDCGETSEFGPLAQLVNRAGEKFDASVRLQTANWLGHPCFMITAQLLPTATNGPGVSPEGAAQSAAFFEEVARRLRAPLNSISGFGEMLQMQEFGPLGHLRYTEYAGDIVTAAHQANVIVDEASELSRLGAGTAEFDHDSVDLVALLERAVGRIRQQANGEQIVIRDNISDQLPDIFGDAMSIAKIVLNLLANAIHVAPSGGQVILTADRHASKPQIDIHIRHSGGHDIQPGLRADFLLFHPQGFDTARDAGAADNVPDPSPSGFGLGLIEALAQANGISIRLQTLSEQDSLMEISIPVGQRDPG